MSGNWDAPPAQLQREQDAWLAKELKAKPPDATHYRNGSWYKIGRHGLTFMWLNDEWSRTSIRASDLVAYEIKRQPVTY